MNDKKLWKAFSEFIRLRDSDNNGYCQCFTCPRIKYWRQMDCGHGLGRQHLSTKYAENNNHAQCKACNGFEEGKKELYAKRVNERYGPQAWELLMIKARLPSKWSQFEVDQLTKHYQGEVARLKNEKGIPADG